MAFNIAILTGRLTKDAELKTTPNGVSVCTFTIAVDTGYGDNKQTAFVNMVAWRKTAELVAKNFRKGSLIGIEGAIQTRNYKDKNGNNRTAFEVVVNNVQFLESKKDKDVNINADEPKPADDFEDMGEVEQDDLPF